VYRTYDEEIHLVRLARRVTAAPATCPEVEWSDVGRSPRFLPGWYILPGFALMLLLVAIVGL
jgi:hypothetical protein